MLGERLQYVLLPGERLQDEAAEDPLTAALDNRTADSELYWKNKLATPLKEVFATCLQPQALQVRQHPKWVAAIDCSLRLSKQSTIARLQ